MQQTTITFPELRLSQRDGHKLRGYFIQQFGADSDLWHNHRSDGSNIYRYPLIQYKVLRQRPMLVGLGEGATVLLQHFFELEELQVDNWVIPINNKQINSRKYEPGLSDQPLRFQLLTPWYALNQKNYERYQRTPSEDQPTLLARIMRGNILSFFKEIDHWVEGQIELDWTDLQPLVAQFKNQKMLMFKGQFQTNAVLPDHIGLGRSVSRGFGSIEQIKKH